MALPGTRSYDNGYSLLLYKAGTYPMLPAGKPPAMQNPGYRHREVQEKLYSLGIRKIDHDEILANLIEENYLNEERFAIQFAGGRYRIKNWGRTKIMYALREKQVNDYCIKKALQQIDETEYEEKITDLARKRYDSLKAEQHLIRK